MIITEFSNKQSLGDQLWRYVIIRTLAEDKGYRFGIAHPERFKGLDLMQLDFGVPVIDDEDLANSLPSGIKHRYSEKNIQHPITGQEIQRHTQDMTRLSDSTLVEDFVQDNQYILHKRSEIREWLKINPERDTQEFSDDTFCIIDFRHVKQRNQKDVFLPRRYWQNAVRQMRKKNPDFRFIVLTDDFATARIFFPDFEIFCFDVVKSYAVIKNAKYLILSNSSSGFFPAWLSTTLKYCIAPKYWTCHNISDGYWGPGYAFVKEWVYLDRKNEISQSNVCKENLESYIKNHKELYGKNSGKSKTPSVIQKNIYIWKILSKDSSALKAFNKIFTLVLADTSMNLAKKAYKTLTFSRDKFRTTPPIKEEIGVFNALKDDFEVVFDVGARDELSFYKAKENCEYHLFEPNKKFVGLLQKQISHFAGHNISVNQFGLSDKDVDDCIYYEKTQGFSTNPYFTEEESDTGVRYSLRTLDGYVSKHAINKIDYLKIDAEGFDYKVLLGSQKAIQDQKISYIQFEYWDGVGKFSNLLKKDFNLYLMMEPLLLNAITKYMYGVMTPGQKEISYNKSIIPLSPELIDLIDKRLAPVGYGGNILAVNKKIPESIVKKALFDISIPQSTQPKTKSPPKLSEKVRLILKEKLLAQEYY